MPKKENIRQLFGSIAGDYDRLNHLMSLDVDKRWRKRAIRQVEGASSVLDLACGTGDFAIAIAKALPACHVTGVDLTEEMLSVMAEKIAAEGLGDRISMEVGDGENLRFEEGSFDCVTIAFGIRNFENRAAGLREMLRVLRPGGKLVILELSLPRNKFIRWCFNLYFLHILPLIGGKISGDKGAYRYLPASVLKFPGPADFMATLRECGFRNITHKPFSLGICRMYTGEK